MGLPASEQRVLEMIESDLRIADQHLAAAFAAFTTFASGTRMPKTERLMRPPGPHRTDNLRASATRICQQALCEYWARNYLLVFPS